MSTDRTSDEQILAGIAEIARKELGLDGPIDRRLRLIEDLKLDSLRMLTLAIEVENRFRVRLDEYGEDGLETVDDLIVAVRKQL